MGGKRKGNLIPPTASLPRTPGQRRKPTMEFHPATAGDPPVAPTKQRQTSLRDYPPPQQLMRASSSPAARSSPVSQTSPAAATAPVAQTSPTGQPSSGASGNRSSALPRSTAPPPPLTTPPLQQRHSPPSQARTAQSPRSSQAQNSHNADADEEEEDEERSDVIVPHPDLTDAQLEDLNTLLLAPRTRKMLMLDPDLKEPDSTWFGFDKSAITRQITKSFTYDFDGPWYSWTCVPRERQQRYFLHFARKVRWHPSLTGVVQEHFDRISQLRMKDMVSNARRDDVQPKWISDTLWKTMKQHWSTEDQQSKSATFSANRLSERGGLGPHVHSAGQKSYRQIEQELEELLGRKVSFGEVFIKAHTRKNGTFVDHKAKQVADAYTQKKNARLSELESDISEVSDGSQPVLSVEEDNEIFISSTFRNARGELFGLGSLKAMVKGKGLNPESSDSFRQLQEQLRKAEQTMQDQAELIRKQEKENVQLAAAQKAQAEELAIVNKFLQTDEKFRSFLSDLNSSATEPIA